MNEEAWFWPAPLKVLKSQGGPYLKTAEGTIGAHSVAVHCSSAAETPMEFRVFLDGQLIFEQGQTTPGLAWYHLCKELGYHAEDHWDLDPALILFHQALPLLARGWEEPGLPFNDLGLPEGVVCLAQVRAAWDGATQALQQDPDGDPDHDAANLVAACFKALPLRAVVFHDDPARRKDYVGTAVDAPLLGIFVHFGQTHPNQVTVAKATLNASGGQQWSSWEPGGTWREEGREFAATQGPAEFLKAAGLQTPVPLGFPARFQAVLEGLAGVLDPVVEAYRLDFPAGIRWHRDARTRYLDHSIANVRRDGGRYVLILEDGTEVVVAGTPKPALTRVAGEEDT
jgi:hypothetical protein